MSDTTGLRIPEAASHLDGILSSLFEDTEPDGLLGECRRCGAVRWSDPTDDRNRCWCVYPDLETGDNR